MSRSVNLEASDRLGHVYEVALRLFSNEGYHAVSLRSLAASAGLSSGSLYTHIDSKQELLYAIIEKSIRTKNDVIRLEIGGCTCKTQQLSAYIRASISHAMRERSSLLLATREYSSLSSWHQQKIRSIQQDIDAFLIEALRNQFEDIPPNNATLKMMSRSINSVLDSYLTLPECMFTTSKTIRIYMAMAHAAMREIDA